MRRLVVVLAVACKAKDDKPQEQAPKLAPYDDNKPTFDGSLELLAPGAQPRAVRRTLGRGRSVTTVATVSLQRFDEGKYDVDTIARDFDVELRGAEAAVTLDKCEHVGATRGPCDFTFKGKRWSFELAPDGSIKQATEVPPARLGLDGVERASIERAIAGVFVPIPTVAIGLGAKWRVRVKGATSGNGDASSDTTYELVAIEDDTLTIAFTSEVTRNSPEWSEDKLATKNSDTGSQRGVIAVAVDGASPARASITERFALVRLRTARQHLGRIETKPSGTPLPVIPATCEETAACCAVAELSKDQRAACQKTVAGKDPAACAEQFSTAQRAMFIVGSVDPACLGLEAVTRRR